VQVLLSASLSGTLSIHGCAVQRSLALSLRTGFSSGGSYVLCQSGHEPLALRCSSSLFALATRALETTIAYSCCSNPTLGLLLQEKSGGLTATAVQRRGI